MKKVFLLMLLMVGLVFSLNACTQSNKPDVEDDVEESKVLDDITINKDQTIDEYAEQEVDEYNDETEKRSSQYNDVLKDSSEDDF